MIEVGPSNRGGVEMGATITPTRCQTIARLTTMRSQRLQAAGGDGSLARGAVMAPVLIGSPAPPSGSRGPATKKPSPKLSPWRGFSIVTIAPPDGGYDG